MPESVELVPGAPTTLTLRLHNSDDAPQAVNLHASGDLAEFVTLDVETAAVESNQIFDIAVSIEVGANVEAGPRQPAVDISSECGTSTAVLAVEVVAHTEHSIVLSPLRSHGSSSGRHTVEVVNAGNVPVTVDLSTDPLDGQITLEVEPTFVVTPGATARVTLRVTPTTIYWNGPAQEHPFVVRSTSSDGSTSEFAATYEQRPRIARWVGPAAAGAGAALLIGAIAWFALLRPWVQTTADDAAASAREQDRAALQEKIDELDAAAAKARELPLGAPTDLRLSVAPAGGNSETDSQTIAAGEKLSVTDVVFQNPSGAVGSVSLLRDGEVLLQSELANFRDYDLHFVAPYVFDSSSEISLEVTCRTPGPGSSDCPVGAAILGFVDSQG